MLDSIELTGGGGYVGRLGDEQMTWLRRELADTPEWKHVVLASHIPIQTALPFTDSSLRAAEGSFTVPGGWGVHSDTPELNELLLDHPNGSSTSTATAAPRSTSGRTARVGEREVSADGPAGGSR